MNWNNRKTKKLVKAFLALKNQKEAENFLRDLLTEQEIIEFGNRWQAAQMLSDKIPYPKIEKETGLSTATIARVSKWLNRGMNGYKIMIQRLNHHAAFPAGKRLR